MQDARAEWGAGLVVEAEYSAREVFAAGLKSVAQHQRRGQECSDSTVGSETFGLPTRLKCLIGLKNIVVIAHATSRVYYHFKLQS